MRFDRFITLNLVQPFRRSLLRIGWGEGERSPDEVHITRHSSLVTSLPVLMYHSISDEPEPGVRSYYRISTSPARFREQMQWLKDNGYRGVSLSEGLKSKSKIENRKSKIEKAVLTFDDGFRDFHTSAWPILREFGFSATMYLPTAFIGSKSEIGNRKSEMLLSPSECRPSQHRCFHGKECLSWEEIQELHRAGIEFGSHTVHHPELVNLPWPEIESEIRDSKSEIENHLGHPCAAFAYPYAFPQTRRDFVDRFKDLLMTGGYETCVTTQLGRHRPGGDALQIKRLPVNQDDDLPLFAAKLAGAYDWLGRFQSLSKTIRRGRNAAGRASKSGKPTDDPTDDISCASRRIPAGKV
jgi:peptidoglycan/xylan/chitin deacetylase (PgdA/CDA1 family)